MKTVDQLKVIFKGVSSVRFASTVQATLATAAWEFELPIVNDSFDVTQAAGTITPTNILGRAGAWATSGTSGDIAINFRIPSIEDSLLGIFYTKTATELSTADETQGAVTGAFEGYGYHLTSDMLEGSMLIISENRQKALFIPNLQGFPAIVLPDGNGTPMGIDITALLVSGNTECDFALLDWTPAV